MVLLCWVIWIYIKYILKTIIEFESINLTFHERLYYILSTSIFHLQWCMYGLCWQGRPQDLGGGGQEIIFSDLGICMSRSDMLRMAKPCALLGGFGGMLPREKFLKRCNLVRFRVYFDQILSLFFSKNAIFYIKNKYFRYTFVMGYF